MSLSAIKYPRQVRRFLIVAVGIWFLAATAVRLSGQESLPAVEPPLSPSLRSVTSISGRFIVSSPDLRRGYELAQWADDTALNVERLTGLRMTFQSRTFHIVEGAEKPEPGAMIGRDEAVADDRLVQTLRIPDLDKADAESLLEIMCALLLDGAAYDRQPAGGRASFKAVPDWLSTGLAQNLHPSLRARNRKIVLRMEEDGQLPVFADVIAWNYLPQGRWIQKPVCGLAFAWMMSGADAKTDMERLLMRLADGEPVPAAWLEENVLHCGSADIANEEWRNWVRRQTHSVDDLGSMSSSLIDKLMTALVVERKDCGLGGATNVAVETSLADLIGMPRTQTLKAYANAKAREIERLSFGKAPEFQETVLLYCRFLDGLSRDRMDFILRHRLKTAEQSLKDLDATVRAREEYLNDFERKTAGNADAGATGRIVAVHRHASELTKYVDDCERLYDNMNGKTNAVAAGAAP